MENKTRITSSKKTIKAGSYTVAITAILLAVLIVVNLIVGALPSKYTVIDTSGSGMYTISATTDSFLHKLKQPVTIYMICEGGTPETELGAFIERYADMSGKLTLKIVDPVKDPTFVSKYTTATLNNNSFIIESERRFKIIDNASLYYYYADGYGQIDSSDSYTLSMLQYYGYTIEPYFNAESVITSAVEYVTAEKIPSVYILTGHGEKSLPSTLSGALESYNIENYSLDITNSVSTIPENASCIVINDPSDDLSESEAAKLLDYIKAGGKLLLLTGSEDTGKKNLLSVVEYYGLSAKEGMVYEGNAANHVTSKPYHIYPSTNSSHDITAEISGAGYKALIPSAHPISITSVRDSVKADVLFATSDKAYISLNGQNSEQKASYNLGVAVSEKVGDKESRIVWFSSAEMLTESVSQSVSYGNYYYFIYSLLWMSETFTSSLSTIPAVSLATPTLVVTEGAARFWSVMFIAGIPLAILIPGIVLWIKRRRR